MAAHEEHRVNIWVCFLLLLLLTAAEVLVYEVWRITRDAGSPFVPKYAMVLIILVVLTLPKAAIVLIFFMHLKFEKNFIVLLAVIPFALATIGVLPMLTDIKTLKERQPLNVDATLGTFKVAHGDHGETHGDNNSHPPTNDQTNSDESHDSPTDDHDNDNDGH